MLSPLSPRIIAAFTTAVGAAAIGLAVATAGTAGANTKDEAFIAQMESIGVTFSSPQVATQQAQLVCKKLASGETGTEIAEEVLSQTNLTTKQAAYFVVDATKAYCPQYAQPAHLAAAHPMRGSRQPGSPHSLCRRTTKAFETPFNSADSTRGAVRRSLGLGVGC